MWAGSVTVALLGGLPGPGRLCRCDDAAVLVAVLRTVVAGHNVSALQAIFARVVEVQAVSARDDSARIWRVCRFVAAVFGAAAAVRVDRTAARLTGSGVFDNVNLAASGGLEELVCFGGF